MDDIVLQEETLAMLRHRKELKEKFLTIGINFLKPNEIIELVLLNNSSSVQTFNISKKLLKKFGTIGKILRASGEELRKIDGITDRDVCSIRFAHDLFGFILHEDISNTPVMDSWQSLLDYCKLKLGRLKSEEFHVLYLNKQLCLIKHEILSKGTIDKTPIYPREIIKKALEYHASAMILVHNHPGGGVTPSTSDIEMTRQIIIAAMPLDIKVHDHIIISEMQYYSFKCNGLI